MRGWQRWAAAVALAGCARGTEPVAPPAPDTPPTAVAPPFASTPPEDVLPPSNVVLVLLDDFGIDLVAGYGVGGDPAELPTLDGLVAEGVSFDRAYATPLCSSTRAALLTGRHGRRTGTGTLIDNGAPFALPLAEVTIAELFPAGHSAAFGTWMLANGASARWEFSARDQGFGWFSGRAGPAEPGDGDDVYYHWLKNTNGALAPSHTYATTDNADDAIAQIAGMPEPWFAYVAFHALHEPCQAPPAELLLEPLPADPSPPERCRLVATAADTELGRILASIAPDVRARTTVIVLGDNGTDPLSVVAPHDPARSKGTLYDGGTHVPLVVAGPAVGVPGARVSALVHVVDVFPTVAALAGVPLTSFDGALDGASLVPLLRDPLGPPVHDLVYTERFAPNGDPSGPLDRDWSAVRDDRYHLVEMDAGFELFDLASDPLGATDLLADGTSAEESAIVEALAAARDAVQASLVYAHP